MREYLFGGGPRYPSRYRFLEVLSVLAYVTLGGHVTTLVVRALSANPVGLWLVLPVGVVGFLVTDFGSGVLHWAADTYATGETPFVGPKFVKPFREHHVDPLAITRHDFIEANGDNCFLGIFVLSPTVTFVPIDTSTFGLMVAICTLTMSATLLLTSVAHGWAHIASPPRFARALQRLGLVVSAEHHAVHHVPPHKRHYCITAGWLNPLLDRIGFFGKLERALAAVGIHPGADAGVDAERHVVVHDDDADQCVDAPEPTASSKRANPDVSNSWSRPRRMARTVNGPP